MAEKLMENQLIENLAYDGSVTLLLIEDDAMDVVQQSIGLDSELRCVTLPETKDGSKGGHPDPEVLVEVRGEDAAEEQSLE